MEDTIAIIKNQIAEVAGRALEALQESLQESLQAGQAGHGDFLLPILVEAPREKIFGDFSVNVAMQLASRLKKPPRQIARSLIENMDFSGTYIDRAEVAGPGFINIFLKKDWLYDALKTVCLLKDKYGRSDIGKGRKVLVEFVSANPTGPLHMGNARGGALGDMIASVLEATGHDVTREYYVNDAGNQIAKLGLSLEARYIQQLKGEDAVEFPEDGYHGEDITEHAKEYIKLYGDKLLELSPEERRKRLVEYALPINLERIRKGLERYGIKYDVWFSEQSLYDSGEVAETISYLEEKGYTYREDGAVWFKGTMFGLDKDVVLVRSNGDPTYFAADMAYHRNKFLVRKFDRAINLWGADHHGHVSRMKGALQAMGIDPSRLRIVLFQLVRLYRKNEIVRMSKRTGKSITIEDLVEEVGRDAARFFFNMKASGNHLDFDMDLAVEQSSDNPVYYVQYAHARICSMLRVLAEEGARVPVADDVCLSLLEREEELDLIKKLAEYPEEVRLAAETLEPGRLTRYALETASAFHRFYNACRVKGEEEELMKARLLLVDCTRIVLRNLLGLLNITAPESM